MKFSVLVPIYNVEEYLEQCILSILGQSYQDFELVLVDDGSTDRSGQICDQYLGKYPEKITLVHKENQGLISARRVGIEHATGEFCVFVDSDDFVEHNLLETLVEYLQGQDNIDMLIYSFQYYEDGKSKQRTCKIAEDGYIWQGENKKELYEKLVCTPQIDSLVTKAIRTEILKNDDIEYKKYSKKNMSEDLLQSLYPITYAKKIVYADKALYNYRINHESVSRSYRPETIEGKNSLHVYEEIMIYLKRWDIQSEEIKKKIDARWFNETMYMFMNYYEGAQSVEDRGRVLDFNWDNMMPWDIYDCDNSYEGKYYKKIYCWWKQGKRKRIYWSFVKRKYYKKFKKWKKVLAV